jgi:hypothetical protein
MWTSKHVAAAYLALAAVVLTGCAEGVADETANASSTPPTTAPSTTIGPSATPTGEATPGILDSEPTPDLDAVAATTAVAFAGMTAFCRPELDAVTWIEGMYPYLSQSAALAYDSVDPANVPCSTLTGDARVRDGDEAHTMRIWVPTDAGDYSVYVSRESLEDSWLINDLVPPTRE